MQKLRIAQVAILFLLMLLTGEARSAKAIPWEDEDGSFVQEEMEWRTSRDKQMRSPTSLLTIAGLFWLKEGENSFGTAASNKIILPPKSAPNFAGKFILKKGKIGVLANEETVLRIKGKPIKEMALKADHTGKPDVVELAQLQMWVIKRGNRYGIRLRDLNAAAFKSYQGLEFFPPREKFKIEADFIPYSSPKMIPVATSIGDEEEMASPGYVKFLIDGKELRLDVFQGNERNSEFFFMFGDETNGKETYGGGRFMVSEAQENGKVNLNFNRAYNPPCAYTPYFTCPLPPEQNILKVRIEAGEKNYPEGHH